MTKAEKQRLQELLDDHSSDDEQVEEAEGKAEGVEHEKDQVCRMTGLCLDRREIRCTSTLSFKTKCSES